ncbi:MAG: hypothetical protein OEZ06_18205 [Myxococcales bacterium]|nr:hypothetical protein [Myxococcales bacterium]
MAIVIDDSALNREYALLRLEQPLVRAPLPATSSMDDFGSIVTVVSVAPHSIYPRGHRLDTGLCDVQCSESAEVALGARAARVGSPSSWSIEHGRSGSPLVDYESRVRAMVHGGRFSGFWLCGQSRKARAGFDAPRCARREC